MKKHSRLIAKILVSIGFIFLLYTLANSIYFNYNLTYLGSHYKKTSFFTDTAELKGKYMYGSRVGDTIWFYEYQASNEVMVWRISRYNELNIPDVKVYKKRFESEDKKVKQFISYTTLSTNDEPYIILKFRTKIKKARSLIINFDEEAKVDRTISENEMLYFSLNFNDIELYSENGADIVLSKLNKVSNANIMLKKYHGNFYIVLLYSTNSSVINEDLLLNIVNLNSESSSSL